MEKKELDELSRKANEKCDQLRREFFDKVMKELDDYTAGIIDMINDMARDKSLEDKK